MKYILSILFFFSHEIGTAAKDVNTKDVDTEDVDTVDVDTEDVATEDAHPQSYEVNGVIPLMFQGAETCCDHDGKGTMLGGKNATKTTFNKKNKGCPKRFLTQ